MSAPDTTPTTPAERADLAAKLAAATQGAWRHAHKSLWAESSAGALIGIDLGTGDACIDAADAAAIAAAVTLVPRLLADIERLEAIVRGNAAQGIAATKRWCEVEAERDALRARVAELERELAEARSLAKRRWAELVELHMSTGPLARASTLYEWRPVPADLAAELRAADQAECVLYGYWPPRSCGSVIAIERIDGDSITVTCDGASWMVSRDSGMMVCWHPKSPAPPSEEINQ